MLKCLVFVFAANKWRDCESGIFKVNIFCSSYIGLLLVKRIKKTGAILNVFFSNILGIPLKEGGVMQASSGPLFWFSFNAQVSEVNSSMFSIKTSDVSKNRGTPKSSILIRFSIINHPFWGTTIFGNTHIVEC